MKKLLLLLSVSVLFITTGCEKTNEKPTGPRTEVPGEVVGNWMYGNFSMTEYWSQDPVSYMGNALEMVFAFTFNADGTYTQYFTNSSVSSGVRTYQQSVSKGTVEVFPATKTIKTHPSTAHYKRTSNGKVVEERDLRQDELSSGGTFSYTTGVEPSGTKALYLTLENTEGALTFLQKQ